MKKKPCNPSAEDLKIQWEINFLTFLITDQNTKKIIQNSYCKALYQKIAFKTDFGPREVLQPKNA